MEKAGDYQLNTFVEDLRKRIHKVQKDISSSRKTKLTLQAQRDDLEAQKTRTHTEHRSLQQELEKTESRTAIAAEEGRRLEDAYKKADELNRNLSMEEKSKSKSLKTLFSRLEYEINKTDKEKAEAQRSNCQLKKKVEGMRMRLEQKKEELRKRQTVVEGIRGVDSRRNEVASLMPKETL
ncbi:MAG: hypothetical protein P4L67_00730 [Candidatus Pacebacteria bacterium]|nr:hypothetical protein [Candidatus Paceibacterota bacterium]